MNLADAITPSMTRTVTTANGVTTWTLAGPGGTITFISPGSLLDIHSIAPRYEDDEAGHCLAYDAGCHHDAGTGGQRIAAIVSAGGDDALFAELTAWYTAHIADTRETSKTRM
jgi:hypothetical protein